MIIDLDQRAIFRPFVKVVAHGPFFRKLTWDHAPLTAGTIQIEQGVDNFTQIDLDRTPALWFWPLEQRCDLFPLGIR